MTSEVRAKDGQLEYFKLANPISYLVIVSALVYVFVSVLYIAIFFFKTNHIQFNIKRF